MNVYTQAPSPETRKALKPLNSQLTPYLHKIRKDREGPLQLRAASPSLSAPHLGDANATSEPLPPPGGAR